MEIRMKTLMAGPNVTRHPGETCVVSAEEGEMLVKSGYAEAVVRPTAEAEKPAAKKPTVKKSEADAKNAEK